MYNRDDCSVRTPKLERLCRRLENLLSLGDSDGCRSCVVVYPTIRDRDSRVHPRASIFVLCIGKENSCHRRRLAISTKS